MEIKFTMQGLLIYLAMAGYLAAALLAIINLKRIAGFLYFVAAVICAAAFFYRWSHVGHVPLQNLFELFVSLGMIIYPISIFSRRVLKISSPANGAGDMLIGFIVLFPAGFVFSAEPQHLPPALQSWLFTPHIAAYVLAYIFMAKAAIQAIAHLTAKRDIQGESPELAEESPALREQAVYALICIGFPFLTAGLLLGSYWGKIAWGDYWNWDPKELWSLAAWLVYVGYFHFRYMTANCRPRVNRIWAIAGIIAIIITLLWVNLARIFAGLHSYAT